MTNDAPQPHPPSKRSALIEKFRRRINTLSAQHFWNLTDAIQEAKAACADCLSMLDIYISEELQGHDARSLYPNVYDHIQMCYDCRRDHDLMLDILQSERAEMPIRKPNLAMSPLSFLRPIPSESPWISRVRSQLASASIGIDFTFNLRYLADRLLPAGQMQPALRLEPPTPSTGPRLLLLEDITLGHQQINVEVGMIRDADRPNALTLHATLASSASLPENLWARLTWAGQTHESPVNHTSHDEGHAQIEGISLTQLHEAREIDQGLFEIAFEVRQPLL